MPTGHIDAGALGERIAILRLVRRGAAFRWEPVRQSWARVELSRKQNHFSSFGTGAAGAELVLRRQTLGLDQAIRWRGQHIFLTAIIPQGRNHLAVSGALVTVSACADAGGVRFPGVAVEKYLRHQEAIPMDANVLRHVLVTPKEIALLPGQLVEVDGVRWPVRTAHLLNPWKNEYEIERTVDL